MRAKTVSEATFKLGALMALLASTSACDELVKCTCSVFDANFLIARADGSTEGGQFTTCTCMMNADDECAQVHFMSPHYLGLRMMVEDGARTLAVQPHNDAMGDQEDWCPVDIPMNSAMVEIEVGDAPNTTLYYSVGGGGLDIHDGTWPRADGDSGAVRMSMTDVPLSQGALLSMDGHVSLATVTRED